MSKLRSLRKRFEIFVVSWAAALAVLILRITCKIHLHDDPRELLRSNGRTYIYAVMHAHQVSAAIDGEPGTGAMVSKNFDGQIIVPALWMRGIVPFRGSGQRKGKASKGGLAALEQLEQHVKSGKPAYLAVDGPAGPRGVVHKGAAVLSMQTGAAVLPMIAIASKRWVLTKAWDRLQIPKPFARIDGYFGKPLYAAAGESSDSFRLRIQSAIYELEQRHDRSESTFNSNCATAKAA